MKNSKSMVLTMSNKESFLKKFREWKLQDLFSVNESCSLKDKDFFMLQYMLSNSKMTMQDIKRYEYNYLIKITMDKMGETILGRDCLNGDPYISSGKIFVSPGIY